ncbi:MAG: zinc-ribbon domain-containing protein [Deltaproteobacteria bacterium]|nr:zinc-ribbon domain-containing protein [Deltaproteobacteria bacterium]
MRVSCEKCASQYNVEDARVPMSGLRMQCTKCGHSFTVERAKGEGGGQGPAATKQAQYQVRRRSGRVFGPFLEGAILKMLKEQTLAGDEDVSLDGNTWTALKDLPAFAAHFGAGGGSDEPELPAPKAPAAPPPAPPATAARPAVAPPPPPGGKPSVVPPARPPAPPAGLKPPPAPPAFKPPSPSNELVDLPAPKRGGAAPTGGARNEEFADLPAPKRANPVTAGLGPIPTGDGGDGFDDFADLPVPKGQRDGGVDLPAPRPGGASAGRQGLVDLPAPKPGGASGGLQGLVDLPTPRLGGASGGPPGLADLPTPKRAQSGLDLPSMDFADLPAPKLDSGMDLLAPKDDRGMDLLAPKGERGSSDQLAPKGERGGIDLPRPKREQDNLGMDLLQPRSAADGLTPKRSQGTVDLPTPRTDAGMDLLQPKAGIALSAPGLELDGGAALEFDELASEKNRGRSVAGPGPAPAPPPRGGTAADLETLDDFDLLPMNRPPTSAAIPAATKGMQPGSSGSFAKANPTGTGPRSLGFGRSITGTGGRPAPPGDMPVLEMPGLELGSPGGNLDSSAPLDLGPSLAPDFDTGLKLTTGAGPSPLDTGVVNFNSPGPEGGADGSIALDRLPPPDDQPASEPLVSTPSIDKALAPRPEPRPRKQIKELRSIPRTPVYAGLLLLILGGGAFLYLKYQRDQKAAARAERSKQLAQARKLMRGDGLDRYKRAAQLAERVATEAPGDLEAKVLASQAFYMSAVTVGGNVAAANKGKSYLASANAAPISPDLKRARGLKSFMAGQLGAARTSLEAAGKDADSLLFLGLVELAAGRGKPALEALRKALELAPKRPDAQLAFAQARVMANDTGALDGLREFFKANPTNLRAELALAMSEPMSALARATKVREIISRLPGKSAAPLESVVIWTRIARQALAELNLSEADVALAEVAKFNVVLPLTKLAQADLAFAREKLDEALPLYDAAITMDPGIVEPLLGRARMQIQLKQYSKAEADLTTATGLDKSDPRVVYWMGRMAEAQRDVANALTRYQAAIELDKGYLEAYLRKAQLHRGEKQNDEANKTLSQAMEQARKDPRAMLALATAYLDGRELDDAEDALRRAIAADPKLLEAHMRLGAVLERQDKLEAARQAYAAAYIAVPGDQDAAVALVRTSLATGKVEEARQVFATAIAAPDVSPRMIAEAALMEYRTGNLARVKELGERLRTAAQENAVGLFAKGAESYRQYLDPGADATPADRERKLSDAVQSFKNALTVDSRAEFHFALGRALVDQKRFDEALQEFAAAVRKDESYADARAGLVRMFILKRRFAEALTEIERLIKQRGNVAEYHRLAGDVAMETNDIDRAFTAYQEALRNNPKDGESYFRLGKIYENREQGREVVRTLEKAVALGNPKADRWMPEAYRALGYALKDSGSTRKAIAAFKKVLAIAPDGTDAEDAERQLAILENR